MKQKRAVLYELMRDHHRGVGANGVAGGRLSDLPGPFEEEHSQRQRGLAGARPFGVPAGYLLLAVAALLIIGLAAYLAGHSRGRANESGNPVAGVPQESQPREPAAREGQLRQTGSAGLPVSPDGGATSSRTAGPIESNPRRIGENYFVLVQTSRTNAIRVAEFCRRHGVEAYVDRANNADFRVFVLPGYTAEEASSPAVADLERRIEEVKKAWNDSVGRNDLGQHIAVKYRG